MEERSRWKELFRFARMEWALPLFFTYALGISLAHYLGVRLNTVDILIGLFIVMCLFAMRFMINAFFDHPDSPQTTLAPDEPDSEFLTAYKRNLILQGSLLVLTAGAMLTAVLIVRHALTMAGVLYLGVALLGYFFLASPPLRLDKTGYGDIVEGIITVNLVPAFSLSLAGRDVSFLLLQLTLPLLFIYMAAKLAFSFRRYAVDTLRSRTTIVTMVGWQNALSLHNILTLGAFILVGVFLLFGLPWSLAWPLLLGLPIGAAQILHMLRIAAGEKPKWKLLLLGALGLFLLMAYLAIISLWL